MSTDHDRPLQALLCFGRLSDLVAGRQRRHRRALVHVGARCRGAGSRRFRLGRSDQRARPAGGWPCPRARNRARPAPAVEARTLGPGALAALVVRRSARAPQHSRGTPARPRDLSGRLRRGFSLRSRTVHPVCRPLRRAGQCRAALGRPGMPATRARIEAWLERTPAARRRCCCARAARSPTTFRASGRSTDPAFVSCGIRSTSIVSTRRRRNHATPGKRVLFVGHIQPLKGMHDLVAAIPLVASRHPEVGISIRRQRHTNRPGRTSLRQVARAGTARRTAHWNVSSSLRSVAATRAGAALPILRGLRAAIAP